MTQQSAACLCIHVCRCSPAFLHMTTPELHPHTPCWADHPNLPGRQAEGWGTGPPLLLCERWTRRGRPSSTWSSRPTCRSGRGSGTGCGALRRDPPPRLRNPPTLPSSPIPLGRSAPSLLLVSPPPPRPGPPCRQGALHRYTLSCESPIAAAHVCVCLCGRPCCVALCPAHPAG